MKQIPCFSKWPALLLLTGAVAVLPSCKKDNNTSGNPNQNAGAITEMAQNETDASGQFDDVFDISMGVQSSDAGEDIGLGTGTQTIYRTYGPNGVTSPDSTARCFTVTVTPKVLHAFPKTVTIDFGSGCLGKDGKMRSGKMVTVFSGPMLVPGSQATTTFVDYHVDSFAVEGTCTIENASTSNQQAWNAVVTNGKISNTQSGKWIAWSGTRDHVQTEGNGTPLYPLDDVYQVTGNSSGSNSAGNSWSTTITQPVIREFSCRWRVQGVIQLVLNSGAHTVLLDYGNGSCDNKAVLTIDGVSYNITLY